MFIEWHYFEGIPFRVRFYFDLVHQKETAWIDKKSLFGWRHVASQPVARQNETAWESLGRYCRETRKTEHRLGPT